MPFRVPAIRFQQKGVPMYLAALPVQELDICTVDYWEPKRTGRWKGYQRGLVQKKIRNLARYLERDDAILPVAGLLNVRRAGNLSSQGSKIKRQLQAPYPLRMTPDCGSWTCNTDWKEFGWRIARDS